jgi:hypothetical protein
MTAELTQEPFVFALKLYKQMVLHLILPGRTNYSIVNLMECWDQFNAERAFA